MTVREAIDWIHHAKGAAIVAHPGHYGLDAEIEQWVVEWGLDGIEIYHRDHSPEEIKKYERMATLLGQKTGKTLLRTGGSDFHHEEYGRKLEPLGLTSYK